MNSSKHFPRRHCNWRPIAFLAIASLLQTASCSSPPGSTTDAGVDYNWRFAFADLEEAVLSVCGTDDQVIAVGGRGRNGLILEWEAGTWRESPLPSTAGTLWWCAASPAGEFWAVGERATILRRSPSGWTTVAAGDAVPPATTLYGVHPGHSEVTVVGGSLNAPGIPPVIARFKDNLWVADQVPTGTPTPLFKVWGDPAGQLWAVGSGGGALHRKASDWQTIETGTTNRLIAVHGNREGRVFAVGGDGVGLLLRWDGARFVEATQSPEPLSGVLVSDTSVTVGGNRGYLASFDLDEQGAIGATPQAQTIAAADLCVHALAAAGGTEIAATADLVGGGSSSWRGSVVFRGNSLVGAVERLSTPDAGVGDAGITDAGLSACGTADAGSSSDASNLPGRGEPCLIAFPACAPGLECWFLQASEVYLCTVSCSPASACVGCEAECCARPGIQTLETVCLPLSSPECQSPF